MSTLDGPVVTLILIVAPNEKPCQGTGFVEGKIGFGA